MNYSFFFLALLFVSSLGLAQTSHINFESGDWESALKKAKKENKVIFVDAYTTWCGPCKMMAKNVFTDDQVSAYYNENFINMKIDMEKGEGILFAKAYDVRAYPTFVFVDAKGNIAHKGLGYKEAGDFIEFGMEATDEENRLGTLISMYKNGERSPIFLKKYSEALKNAYDDHASDIANEYLETQADWSTEKNATYVVEMAAENPNDKLFQYIAEHRNDLLKFVDQDNIDSKIKMGIMRQIHMEKIPDAQHEALFSKFFDEKGAEYYAEYVMRKNSRLQNDEMKANYFKSATHYINTYKITDWRLLNQVAWTFYEHAEDNKQLKQARDWAMTSVKQNSNFMNNDTVAALCYKLGDKNKAMKYANQAILLAKESGEDYAETEKLLEKIQAL